MTTADIDWQLFAASLGDISHSLDPNLRRQKSSDFGWFSPVLKRTLDGKVCDIVVTPRNEAEVIEVLRLCVERRAPVTARGGGTGNYGQIVPMEGGVILDLSRMTAIRWLKPGQIRCEPGLPLHRLDDEAGEIGWELRLYPSTKRTATIGGFIAGGSSGVGAIQYGLLRDPGNINGLRVVTMEETPRVIELRGAEVNKVNHAYGANGIITEIELPLAPAHAWVDNLVVFDDFAASLRFGQAVSCAEGLIKKEVSAYAWPVPAYLRPLRRYVPEGKAIAICMIAEESIEWFDHLVGAFGGTTPFRRRLDDGGETAPLYECCWNHTTLHAIKADPSITYLQCLFAPDRNIEKIEEMHARFGDEAPMHTEFVRLEGRIGNFGLQLFRYTGDARLDEAIAFLEDNDVPVFNPHTHILEDGGMKVVDRLQLDFKREADPHGLLNPGKMRGWWEQEAVAAGKGALYRA